MFPRSIALLLTAAAPLVAQKPMTGWTYTMNMTVDSGGAARTTNIAMRYSVTDSKLRQEFVQISGMPQPMSIEGMYMVMSVADSTMLSVMPEQHAATIAGFPGVGIDMKNLRFTSHVNETVEDLGDGGRIFGHATRHVRVTMNGTIDHTLADGRACSIPADGVNEMWIAPDIDITPAMIMSMKQFGLSASDISANASQSKVPKGLPLRMVMQSSRGGTKVTTTVEYRDVAQKTFDPSYFEAPAGYQVMDLRKYAKMVPKAMMDSIQASVADKTFESCSGGRP